MRYLLTRFYNSNSGRDYDGRKLGKRDTEKRVIVVDDDADAFDIERELFDTLTGAGYCDGFLFCDYKDASKRAIEKYNRAGREIVKRVPFSYYNPKQWRDLCGLAGAYNMRVAEIKEIVNEQTSIY